MYRLQNLFSYIGGITFIAASYVSRIFYTFLNDSYKKSKFSHAS